MGLCKCPKRKVTNLFCFEHRVNVCEHCLVANHAKVGHSEDLLSRALGGLAILASSKPFRDTALECKLHKGKDLVYFAHCYSPSPLESQAHSRCSINVYWLYRRKDVSLW